MRSWFIAVAMLFVLLVQGCGGGGSSSPSTSASPFAGSFKGTFVTTDPQSGTINLTVATNGSLTGAVHNDSVDQDATVSGSVTNAGTASVEFTYPTFSASANGTVAFASNGHLLGTLNQSTGGSVTIDLIKQ